MHVRVGIKAVSVIDVVYEPIALLLVSIDDLTPCSKKCNTCFYGVAYLPHSYRFVVCLNNVVIVEHILYIFITSFTPGHTLKYTTA